MALLWEGKPKDFDDLESLCLCLHADTWLNISFSCLMYICHRALYLEEPLQSPRSSSVWDLPLSAGKPAYQSSSSLSLSSSSSSSYGIADKHAAQQPRRRKTKRVHNKKFYHVLLEGIVKVGRRFLPEEEQQQQQHQQRQPRRR